MVELSCHLPANFKSINTLRELLKYIGEETDTKLEKYSGIELALIEIFTNIVKHSGVVADDLIDVRLRSDSRELEIKFIDTGEKFLPTILETVMPHMTTKKIELLPESGFGVPLVVSLSDSVRYERKDEKNFTTLIFVLDED